MRFFKKKDDKPMYDEKRLVPVIRCSICTGEQVAGFKDKQTGRFESAALILSDHDLLEFRRKYGIKGEIKKIY